MYVSLSWGNLSVNSIFYYGASFEHRLQVITFSKVSSYNIKSPLMFFLRFICNAILKNTIIKYIEVKRGL